MGFDFEEGENMSGLGYESVFSGFESFGSTSSSDLSTLVGSERDSTEVESSDDEEDDEFMAELSRRMADYMLDDEEEDNKDDQLEKNVAVDSSDSENFKASSVEDDDGEGVMKGTKCVISTSSIKESDSTVGYQLSPAFPADVMQPIQLYQVENQPKVNMSMGSRGKKTESTQQQQLQNEMCKKMGKGPPNGGGGSRLSNNYGKGHPPPYVGGSGMRAVFLGGVGSRNASSGTGVFLPRTIAPTPHQPLKKSGCSTVLIPTRVLQVLEQHFSNVKSPPPSNGHSSQHGRIIRDRTQEKGQAQSQPSRVATMDHQASQLPQEWTY